MLIRNELIELGFIPKTNYTMGRAFPPGWKLPETIPTNVWKKLPLYINIRYNSIPVDNMHKLK